MVSGAKRCVSSLSQLWAALFRMQQSRLGRFSAGLDVGSAGLFWLRGVGLCKHAKLAASSKRIGESGESSWNLLFLSLTLASRCLIPAPLKPFLMMTLSASHWKAVDRRPRGLQHRGIQAVAATLVLSPSCLLPELFISFFYFIFYHLALNMHKQNNLQTPSIWKCAVSHSQVEERSFCFFLSHHYMYMRHLEEEEELME